MCCFLLAYDISENMQSVPFSSCVIDQIPLFCSYLLIFELERWLSGLKRLPAKQESGKPDARVRIPLSPPVFAPKRSFFWLTPSSKKRRLSEVVRRKENKDGPVFFNILTYFAPIAQLDRASDYGSEGWGFDSSWAHQPTPSRRRQRLWRPRASAMCDGAESVGVWQASPKRSEV